MAKSRGRKPARKPAPRIDVYTVNKAPMKDSAGEAVVSQNPRWCSHRMPLHHESMV